MRFLLLALHALFFILLIGCSSKSVYIGELKDGKPHGKGILRYYSNGQCDAKYIGEFKDGKRDGEGKWTMFDGSSYEGEWKLDKFHGKGRFIYQNDVQEGYWFMGRFQRYLDEVLDPCNYIETIK